jgi:hypothetical protein
MVEPSTYRIVRATWRDIRAVRRLEVVVFPQDAKAKPREI